MVDTHTHIHESEFNDRREDILNDMHTNHIRGVLVGTDLTTSRAALRLAEQYPHLCIGTVGIHPHEAETVTEADLNAEKNLIQSSAARGVGETGLDYAGDLTSERKERQQYLFRRQIDMARMSELPLIIHTRDAWADTYEMLQTHAHPEMPIVLHCFTGNTEWARRFLETFPSLMISFSGIVTFRKKAEDIQEAARHIPPERMLAETDSPYLAPEPYRGTRNDTRNIRYVIQKLADLQGVSIERLDAHLDVNAQWMFGEVGIRPASN